MIRDLRISANNRRGVVQKIPILNHRVGDFRVGIEAKAAAEHQGNFLLISKHGRHVSEVRATLPLSIVSGGVKTIPQGVQTEIKCSGKRIIVKTFRDGTKQVAEVFDNG